MKQRYFLTVILAAAVLSTVTVMGSQPVSKTTKCELLIKKPVAPQSLSGFSIVPLTEFEAPCMLYIEQRHTKFPVVCQKSEPQYVVLIPSESNRGPPEKKTNTI